MTNYIGRHCFCMLILILWGSMPGHAQDYSPRGVDFDNGVGAVTPDSTMSVNFQFLMQNLVEFNTPVKKDSGPGTLAAKIQRLRLKLNGFVVDPRLTYQIQLALAAKNTGSAAAAQMPRVIYDAMIYYRFNDHFKLGFGQTVVPATRQRMNSGGALQLVDRSLLNSLFNLDLDFGLHAEYKMNPSARRPLVLHGAVTTGEGRNWVVVEEPGLSYTGRVDWYPLGSFIADGGFKEGDLEWHIKPRLMIGAAYNFNDRAQRTGGQRGSLLYHHRDIKTMTADFIFKYKGWSLLGDYIMRDSDDPVNSTPAGSQGYIYNGSGVNIQVSRYFPSYWEIVGRFSNVVPDREIDYVAPEHKEWTLGISRYIRGRMIKIQGDVTLFQSNIGIVDLEDEIGFRVQAQVGI